MVCYSMERFGLMQGWVILLVSISLTWGQGAPFLFRMGASKNTVWGMAAYDLRGMEDGNFYRLKFRIAMENEGIPLSQTAFPKG